MTQEELKNKIESRVDANFVKKVMNRPRKSLKEIDVKTIVSNIIRETEEYLSRNNQIKTL